MVQSWLIVAQTVPLGGYFSYGKMAAVCVLFLLWCLVCQWVDRDTDVVKTKREQWNIIVLAGGILGLAVLFLIPWKGNAFYLGLAFWIILASGSALAYVIHRNGRVVANARVMTPTHFKRLLSSGPKEKKKSDVGQRIRIANSEGKAILAPDDPDELQHFTLTQDFLFDVLWRRASDADMVVGKERVRVLYRVDGVPIEAGNGLTREDAERVLTYLKTISGQNPEERRRPQKGQLQVGLLAGPDMGSLEVYTSGSNEGERLRLKLREAALLKKVDEIGLAGPRLEAFKALLQKPSGLVLISGPKQSGVTTTQYAAVKSHDAFTQNIYSIETHPLLDLDNITQNKHVEGNSDVSYARQLQSVLRREPDLVLIGECPDRETAQLAARAVAGDKKIYMAVEGADCFDALEKFRKLLDDNALLGKVLLAITSQRLVRVLCSACRQAYRPDPAVLKKANLPADKIEQFFRPPTEPILDKKGNEIICQVCQGTGYSGRTAVFELLVTDPEMSKLVAGGADIRQIKAQARKNKMYYLQEEGLFKVIDGTTSMNEIIRALKEDVK